MENAEILLVEDNFVNQKLAMAYFKKMGKKIDLAENGVSAIEKMKEHNYRMVFMDLQMPEMDGFEATRQIRNMDLQYKPIIVAMTANVFKEDKEKCFQVGMDDFLGKPVRQKDIQEILDKYKESLAS